ncbi:sugar ABC transporter substrate-binding protein [Streptoalloteichus hindustanus]|uniref:N,N'-diacetylchitobiose transport system substrate-binding protein n=1 Tax=Streptoalloteichus hindustanus TaxID=2017 RepID=A0A1M4W6P1_STRHI|nr:sugar ABC transporter substrate-binding protein [Streptoalloteichus hindustanus]SHE76954.1 N,N'-diacetylchitobiose transport system substrate-binding protein [Streptoalloteichus hindustanus]
MKRWKRLAVGAAALAVATSGCGMGGSSGSGGDQGGDKTLTVWLMDGSAPKGFTDELHKEFEGQHPGVKVKYEVQLWKGIQDKLVTALASNNPPDVIELGNTQTARFSAENTLTDLTGSAKDLAGDQWLSGLKESATWDGKQYAMPFYAANRTVIYRKDLFEKAGVTKTPTSREEWLDAIRKVKAANAGDPEFEALYLPGQSWYVWLSFLWDEGGEVTRQDGKNFKAAVDSPEAKAAVEYYKQLVDTAGTKAAKDQDEATPQQYEVFAKGKTAMMVALPWEHANAVKANPQLKEVTAAFPIPSKEAGRTAPVFLGGSNVAIPAGSKRQDLAKDYLKLLSSVKYQNKIAKDGGAVPGTSKDVSALASDPVAGPMALAAQHGRVTPTTPKWGPVEAGQNPLKDMLTAALTGQKTPADAVRDANAKIGQALGG